MYIDEAILITENDYRKKDVMTKTEIRHIAENLVDELRELPDGTEITSAQLLKKGGYDIKGLDDGDMFDYHDALFRVAKANHIMLDMSKHDGKEEGLPWNLDFVVHNKKAQIKCPYCGSKDTARILYGMPDITEDLQEKLDSGKVHLGGDVIIAISTDDGKMIYTDPERYCNHCKKEFGRPPYWHKDDLFAYYPDMVEAITFEVGGFFQGRTIVSIKKNPKGALVRVGQFPHKIDGPVEDRQITPLRWMRLVNKLYNELYINEWKKSYEDPNVLDGTQWELEIKLNGRRKRTYSGSNAYPPYWMELIALFSPFAKL